MMRKLGILVGTIVLMLAGSRPSWAAGNDAPALDRLKALVGEWEGTNPAHPVKITYTLVAGGTALMERMQPAHEAEMITMYSQDGDSVVVTHYCSQGNQPTMKTEAMKAKVDKYSFKFVSVSGLKTPDEGHMVGLVLTLVDRDHLTQEWKYTDKGRVSAEVFEFKRKPDANATIVPTGN